MGKGDRKVKPRNRRQPEDQACRGPPPEQQDVKAVSVRHCAATTVPRNCCPNCCAEQSHNDYVRSSAVGKQLKQKKSNSLSIARHHHPALDLFCTSFFLRVLLTSLLLISPGLCLLIGPGPFCFTSTEARLIIREGDRGKRASE